MSSFNFKADEFEYCKIQCVCIESNWDSLFFDRQHSIQEGCIYTCEGHPESICYSVKIDNKYYGAHEKKYFITLAEWRNKQIDKILEDE